MDKAYGVIYKITNPKGEVYIGQTVNFHSRMLSYMRGGVKSQKKVYNSLQEHGVENHEVEIIFEAANRDELSEKEVFFINKYDSVKNGLNCNSGGITKPTNESKGKGLKKSYNVYLEPWFAEMLIQKHGTLTKAILTSINEHDN